MAAQRVDIANERLALQLSRADVEEQLRLAKVEAQRTMLTDQLAALDLQLEEFARLEDRYAGQRMQQSMYTAMLADSRAIADQRRLEQQAFDDRLVAAAVGRAAPVIPDGVRQQLSSGNFDDQRLTQLEEARLDDEEDPCDCVSTTQACSSDDGSVASSFADTGTTMAEKEEEDAPHVTLARYMNALHLDEARPLIDCVVCTDPCLPSQTVTLQCDHTWCRGCMSQRYEEATVNEGAWPVKCCRTDIPTESVRHLLSIDQRTRFAIKAVEWADTDRTYCHEPSCSTYIPHSSIADRRAPCSTCQRETCAECKNAYHALPPCLRDTRNDDLLAETARLNHWPKCPGCKRYVEISTGCNHMTCHCRTEFCYECSNVWKGCRCPQWHVERLVVRANEVADRQGRADVGRVAEELVSRHECGHERWTKNFGGGECNECEHFLQNYLWRCRRCHLEVCHRCRFSRI